MKQIKKIKETCLYIADIERTVDFYHHKMGFELISEKANRHAFFRIGSDVLLCFLPEVTKYDQQLPPHFAHGDQHLAFEVARADYENTKAKFADLGIPIIHEEKWRENVYSFYFKDPDGNVLEIVTEGLWD
ncbi:MAG: VOC family protein [Bacteroidota bacterium]